MIRRPTAPFAAAFLLAAWLAHPAQAQKPAAGGSAPVSAPVATAAAGTRAFTSDASTLPAEWRAAYVPIAFSYPSDWRLDPSAAASGFLVNVTRPVPGYAETEVSEIFAAFPFQGSEASLDSDIATALSTYGDWMRQAWGFPGSTRSDFAIGGRSFPALAFQGVSDSDETLWGRLVIVPLVREAGQVKGVGLVMVGSTLASEIRGVEDVGARGGMPTILATFRGGSMTAAVAPVATPAPMVTPAPAAPPVVVAPVRNASPAAAPAASQRPSGLAGFLASLGGGGTGGSGTSGLSSLLGLLGAGGNGANLEASITQLLGGTTDPELRGRLGFLLTQLQSGAPTTDVLAALQPILARFTGGSGISSPAPAATPAPTAAPASGGKPGAGH